MARALFYLAVAALIVAHTSSYQASLTFDDANIKADSLVNIYLDYGNQAVQGTVTLLFRDCDGAAAAYSTTIGSIDVSKNFKPTKFVWAVPADAKSGCIVAIDSSGKVIASSVRYIIGTKMSKRGHSEFDGMHFDAVNFHKTQLSKKRGQIVASDKSEKIGIVGAGMSGLFSGLLLEQAGIHNYEILEANNRLGGRVHTSYFENNSHSLDGTENSITYQELGPMRFPVSWTYENRTLPITDHRIVFQMADELNGLNSHDKSYRIDFIKWVESTKNNLLYKNGMRLTNGKVPTVGQVDANASLSIGGAPDLAAQVDHAMQELYTDSWFKLMSKDLYEAHEKAIKEGYEDWSEWGWLHNKMGLSLNVTDYATGLEAKQIWRGMYDVFTFTATDWRTVQGGLTRLAKAYEPILGNKVEFGVRVSKVDFEEHDGKISVQWKDNPYDTHYKNKTFDNVIISVPFSLVRTWHLPALPYTLRSAIDHLGYGQACKVAMEFKSRFWEHYELPIFGGCDTTDLYTGSICYPSNNLTADGPGVMLASYASGDQGLRLASMTDEQHIARVLDDLVELHGDIVKEQYTGNFDRMCWILNEFESGSWATPEPGQHKLYMPSYFEMNNGLVFVGEHTDIKQAWISAALESAVRGVVMTLVEHGHIKEAKDLVKKWDAKWMKI